MIVIELILCGNGDEVNGFDDLKLSLEPFIGQCIEDEEPFKIIKKYLEDKKMDKLGWNLFDYQNYFFHSPYKKIDKLCDESDFHKVLLGDELANQIVDIDKEGIKNRIGLIEHFYAFQKAFQYVFNIKKSKKFYQNSYDKYTSPIFHYHREDRFKRFYTGNILEYIKPEKIRHLLECQRKLGVLDEMSEYIYSYLNKRLDSHSATPYYGYLIDETIRHHEVILLNDLPNLIKIKKDSPTHIYQSNYAKSILQYLIFSHSSIGKERGFYKIDTPEGKKAIIEASNKSKENSPQINNYINSQVSRIISPSKAKYNWKEKISEKRVRL